MLDWRLEELGIERLCAAGEYRGALRNALVKLKYGNGRYLAPWLGRLLAPQLVAITGDGAALLSVPLHAKRQQERGYNQSLCWPANAARLAGRNVVIVDDIVTTGSTVIACARTCLRVEAGRLYVAAVAHG